LSWYLSLTLMSNAVSFGLWQSNRITLNIFVN